VVLRQSLCDVEEIIAFGIGKLQVKEQDAMLVKGFVDLFDHAEILGISKVRHHDARYI